MTDPSLAGPAGGDPRTATALLSDDYPVLLGPVRLETRWTATHLLVRIFPDEWALDAFEPEPSGAEIAAVDRYWRSVAAAARASGAAPAHSAPGSARGGPAANGSAPADPQLAAWRDLAGRVGPGRAAWLVRTRRPANAAEVLRGAAPEPAEPDEPAEPAPSWTRPARARLLPERFLVLGFIAGQQVFAQLGAPVVDGLAVSPDPAATGDDQLRVNPDGSLHVPPALRWLTDYDTAEQAGMAVSVPLTDAFRERVDRLLVIGLRPGADPDAARADLETHLGHLHAGPGGLSLLPVGTPTNNTERVPAGTTGQDPAEAQLRVTVEPAATARAAAGGPDWRETTDGQWLAELLGVDPAALAGLAHADGTDQREARAANLALWPATWGYFLHTLLYPVLPPDAVEEVEAFFTRYVSGRGPLPSVRIGRQPYGILATTAFSRLTLAPGSPRQALRTALDAVAADWSALAASVSRLGADGDPHQMLLDILALHPASVEFHQRYSHSVEDLFNRDNLDGRGMRVPTGLAQLGQPAATNTLLAHLGRPAGGPEPDVARHLPLTGQHPLRGPLVQEGPPSPTAPLGPATTDGADYLTWLAKAGRADLDQVRLENAFPGAPPAALLYLLARHAVLLGWADAAVRLAAAAGGIGAGDLPAARREPPFIHVSERTTVSESRFARLYSPDPAVTGDPDRLLVEHIPQVLGQSPATAPLAARLDALALLAGVPTARLERLLIEHLDLATHRMDAWRLGLATERLFELRYGAGGTGPARPGLHIGAYGWLEDLRPRAGTPEPVTLTGDLATIFTPPGSAPLVHDPGNGGHLHAPSLTHAATAAVLRAGYLANASPDTPGALAVNLDSARVRTALSFLEGVRGGQPLGALLGYQLERGLHDGHDVAEVDAFISVLRGAFPLVAGRLPDTSAPAGTPIEAVEARNVVDGLALVRQVTRSGVTSYPYGRSDLPPATAEQAAAIDAEVARLLRVADALGDLALAEGVHQAVLGNPERVAATLDAYAKAGFPPEPAVVETPRSGVTLTHRLALNLPTDRTPPVPPPPTAGPRVVAEPAVARWLADLFPPPRDVAVRVTWTDPDGTGHAAVIGLDELDLSPIDLLWTLRPEQDAAMAELDDQVIGRVVQARHPRADAPLSVRYTERIPGKITLFELSPLVAALREALLTARPLRPSDVVRIPAAADPGDLTIDDAMRVRRDRPQAARDRLAALGDDLADFVADLEPLAGTPEAVQRDALLAGVDTFLARFARLAARAGTFGLRRAGWAEFVLWRRAAYTDLLAAVDVAADRMAASLAAADELIAEYDALPPQTGVEPRFALLQQAERLLTTAPTSPRPATPAQLRATVGNRRAAFANRLAALRGLAGPDRDTLSDLIADTAAVLPISDFDATGLDLTPVEDRVVAFCADLLGRARATLAEVTARTQAADAALADHDAATEGPDRVAAALAAIRAVLGPDALAVPEFTLPAELAEQWEAAIEEAESGRSTAHLDRDFPVDDWLHGVARVRGPARLVERITLLCAALGRPEPTLLPAQLPARTGEPWLGLELPPGHRVEGDRLLYTAHYAKKFDKNGMCGLLLDEWTEVIPAATETTGIAFHYDRPGTEPPQALLLVVPPRRTGAWAFDDLVAALHETLDLAAARAVEPAQLDATPYAQLLPATALAATRHPITISTDLARNNQEVGQ